IRFLFPGHLRTEVHANVSHHIGEALIRVVQIQCGVGADDEGYASANEFINRTVVEMPTISEVPEFMRRTIKTCAPFRQEQMLCAENLARQLLNATPYVG